MTVIKKRIVIPTERGTSDSLSRSFGKKSDPVAIDISKYTKTILKIAKEGFKKGFKSVYNRELHTHIFDDLSTAAELGYGNNWIKFDPHHSPTVKLLQKNLYFFVAGKPMAQLKEMNALLVDDSGKIRNWQSFKTEVLKRNKAYNLRYLQAEYQTAKASAQMARKWNEAQAVKHLYPNLKYMTAHDERVREDHAKLDGIVRPIDDAFWDTHYPPNGWRCRCSVRSTRDEATKLKDIPKVPVHKHFRHNVGKIGQIFDEKQHPYFKYINEQKGELEWWKLKDPHYVGMYKSKGKVFASIFADRKDYQSNLNFAKAVAEQHKLEIYIKSHIDKTKIENYLKKVLKGKALKEKLNSIKNNEYEIKIGNEVWQGDLAEQKGSNPANTVSSAFSHKFGYTKTGTPKQLQVYDKVFIGIALKDVSSDTFFHIAEKLNQKAKIHTNLKGVILKINSKVFFLKREKLMDSNEIHKTIKTENALNK